MNSPNDLPVEGQGRRRPKLIADETEYESDVPALKELDQADKSNLAYLHYKKSEEKRKAFPNVMFMAVAKLVIAGMLLVAIFPMEYDYYHAVRVVVALLSIIMCLMYLVLGNKSSSRIFAVFAVLFNPIFPITMGRSNWIVVDVVAAVISLATIYSDFKTHKKASL